MNEEFKQAYEQTRNEMDMAGAILGTPIQMKGDIYLEEAEKRATALTRKTLMIFLGGVCLLMVQLILIPLNVFVIAGALLLALILGMYAGGKLMIAHSIVTNARWEVAVDALLVSNKYYEIAARMMMNENEITRMATNVSSAGKN